jgi:hypothetical protein
MTQEDIIKLAREAGLYVGRNISGVQLVGSSYEEGGLLVHLAVEELERFAALVAAHEREKVAAWMMSQGYATGHGDTVEDLLKELEWQIAEREREACAKVCDVLAVHPEYASDITKVAAQAIRARGEK